MAMRERMGKLYKLLTIVFFVVIVAFFFVPQMPHFDWGNNDESDSSNNGSSDSGIYPELTTAREDISNLEKQYSKEGYRFIQTNTNRAGPATIQWLNRVNEGAKDKMKKTDRSNSRVLNDFLHNAIVQENAAALEDYIPNTKYPDGHNIIILVVDQGDVKALEVSRDDTSIDTSKLKNVYDILNKPEEMVKVSDVKSLLDQARDVFNQTKSEEKKEESGEKVGNATETKTPSVSTSENAGSYSGISRRGSNPNSGGSTGSSGQTGSSGNGGSYGGISRR